MSQTTTQADSWGSPAATASSTSRRVPHAAAAARDDWDSDSDEKEHQEEDDPQKLWVEANRRAPMPIVTSGSSTSAANAVSPPPAAFQPTLRILKRPTANSSSSVASSLPASGNNPSSVSYLDRESRYQAARSRIFESSSSDAATSLTPERIDPEDSLPKSIPAVKIARAPRGPPPAQSSILTGGQREGGGDSRGIGNRRGKRRGGVKNFGSTEAST